MSNFDSSSLPILGSSIVPSPTPTQAITNPSSAALTILSKNITALSQMVEGLISNIEGTLSTTVLPITDDPTDAKLSLANDAMWPEEVLGTPRSFISYAYYKGLEGSDSSAAQYIRNRYEQAAQELNGTNAIEIIRILKVIDNECSSIEDFIALYGLSLNDSSEQRVSELAYEWVQNALSYTGTFGTIFQTGTQTFQLPATEVSQLTAGQAKQAQALFKVKINILNEQLTAELSIFEKNFKTFGSLFWTANLGPALEFRQNITSNYFPQGGLIGQEITAATGALNSNLSGHLTDQMRRNMLFDSTMSTLVDQIKQRDTYRGYIQQLAPVGTNYSINGPGYLNKKTAVDPEDQTFFSKVTYALATPNFISYHAATAGLLANDHPQYLLRSEYEADKKKKAVVISTTPTAPILEPPTDLQIILQSLRPVPPNTFVVDALLQFEGDPEFTYNVEITPVAVNPGTPPPTSSSLVNGGFESDLTGWTIVGTLPTPVISTIHVHGGVKSLLLGTSIGTIEPIGDSSVTQTIILPSGSPQLSLWYWPFTTDSITFDWQEAQILNSSGVFLAQVFKVCSNAQAWTNVTFDLSPWAGQTIKLFLNVHEDGAGDLTYAYFDDISIT